MSGNIIIKVTFSISGHGKSVEKNDVKDVVGQNPDFPSLLHYDPKNDGEVWVLGMKNAGICSLGNPELESFMDDHLKKYDLQEYVGNYLEYLNNITIDFKSQIKKANQYQDFTDQTQWQNAKIQKEGNDWAYFQQTKIIGNKTFGGEPDQKRQRYIPVRPNGPTIKIYSIQLIRDDLRICQKMFDNTIIYLENPIRFDELIPYIKNRFSNASQTFKQTYPDFFDIMEMLHQKHPSEHFFWNYQIYDETCNHTISTPSMRRYDSALEKVTAGVLPKNDNGHGGGIDRNNIRISISNKKHRKKHSKKHSKKHRKKHSKKHN